VANNFIPSVNYLGQLIIGTQVLRAAAVFLWPRLRRVSNLAVAEVFCVEVFSLPVLGLAAYLTGDQVYSSLVIQVFVSWIASLMVVYPSVIIFQYARSMYNGARLSTYLPASALVLGLLVSYQGVHMDGPNADGLRGLLVSFIAKSGGVSFGNPSLSLTVTASSIAVIFSVALYCAILGSEKSILRNPSLFLVLGGVILMFGWGWVMGLVASNAILLFTAPTAVIGGTIWWLTREKRS
jgi:hypothetical protein